jgi:hypothetical protein
VSDGSTVTITGEVRLCEQDRRTGKVQQLPITDEFNTNKGTLKTMINYRLQFSKHLGKAIKAQGSIFQQIMNSSSSAGGGLQRTSIRHM